MPGLDRIDYTILYVRDLAASIRFYRDVLGLPFRFEDHGYAEFSTEGSRFALLDRSLLPDLIGADPAEVSGPAPAEASHVEQDVATGRGRPAVPAGEIAILVEDVDAHAARLREAGVAVLSGPVDRPWGHRTLHLADPDGHVVELAQEIPRARPRDDPAPD